MYGAMIGDYVGSVYEWHNIKTKDFPLFARGCKLTDDSFMTIAVAQACLNWSEHYDFDAFTEDVKFEMTRIGLSYPNKGYGGSFRKWLYSKDGKPYGSYGNGSAMRVSPCAWIAESLEHAEQLGEASALPTHNHPEGIKGARAVAAVTYLARMHGDKEMIRGFAHTYYDMSFCLDDIREDYKFDVTCMGTVPPAIMAFLESNSFEDAIRNAISIGGDSDTIAAITGGIAEAYYGVPSEYRHKIYRVARTSCTQEEQRIISRFTALVDSTRVIDQYTRG